MDEEIDKLTEEDLILRNLLNCSLSHLNYDDLSIIAFDKTGKCYTAKEIMESENGKWSYDCYTH